MDARRIRRQALSRTGTLTLALLTASFVHAGSALAAGQTAVAAATASPASFVPDWDGHTDSTVISYRLVQRSTVGIRVLDARGRVVSSINVGVRDAGVHAATWDGRAANGAVQAPGTYRVRVDARPVRSPATATAAGAPGSAELGGGVAVAGARAATVTLQRSDVTVTAVHLDRATIGAGRRSGTSARFQLSRAATVSAAIVDANGTVMRTLATGRMRAGSNTVAWDARANGGAWVRDGNYSLVLAATGGGRPTATTRLPLTVDRSAPTMTASARVRATVTADSRISIPLQVTAGEVASIVVRLGRRSHRASLAAGSNAIRISGDDLGLRAAGRARVARVLVTAVDGAGNTTSARTTVTIPPRSRAARPRPVAPTPTAPKPVSPTPKPPITGRWPWPVGGVVTSEFGLRDGRQHAGLDIAAPTGTPIHPSAPGTISFVGAMSGYGNTVDVRHANGMLTRYAHLSRFGGFAVGAAVTQLDTIGLVGCTGTCSGPHVHFETRVADIPRDPRGFLTPR